MKKFFIIPLSILFLIVATAGFVNATPITVNGITFVSKSENLTITNGVASGNEVILYETVTGMDVTMQVFGLYSYKNPDNIGDYPAAFWLTTIVTNSTESPWNFYDHELQRYLGVPSTDGDSLSFAQGTTEIRPWTSNKFSGVDEVVDERDYINFYDGIVEIGETVEFRYAISQTDIGSVYLRQRPNYATTEPVPEPATMLLLFSGLAVLVAVRRKFRKK